MQRVGVFVCWCGSNIAGTVDVQAVSDALKNEPGLYHKHRPDTTIPFLCG